MSLVGGQGVKLNAEKQLEFLLESLDFPAKLTTDIHNLFSFIRGCTLPDPVKYKDLFDKTKLQFVFSK